jgi:HAD superfamily hydrolase (TIGR01549 family)
MTFVGFDFDHTLGVDNHLERTAFGTVAARLGAPIDVEATNEAALIERVLVPFRRGDVPMPEMMATFVAQLPPPAQTNAPEPATIAEWYRDACFALVESNVAPLDGARACIDALVESGARVGILTNGWSPLQEKKIARALGTFPGPVLVSDAIGAYKPSSEAFAALERALGCSAQDLWYVGDNPRIDIGGAHAYGVRAVWLEEDGVTYPSDLAPPDAHIRSLHELVAIVRGS